MHTAIKWITGIVEDTKLKNDDLITLAWKDHILKYVDKTDPNKHYYLDNIPKFPFSPDKCKGYKERLKMHKSYFFKNYNDLK